jgi:hypothetical protein
MPGGLEGIYTVEEWDRDIARNQQAIDESSGYQRKALEIQQESAKAARKNAMEIAQLQAHTSRYGIDAQTQTALADRVEKARQFDADHGLDIAKTYATFGSTYDRHWAMGDFMSAMGRVGQGLSPAPIASQPQPHAKTWEDFSSIAQYNGSTVPGAGGGGQASASSGGGAGSGQASSANPTDPRVTAASAIMKAVPPSETVGHDENDYAALESIRNMYMAGKPGVQKLGAERQKLGLAGMGRLGYNPALVQEEYLRGLPGQKSPLLSA